MAAIGSRRRWRTPLGRLVAAATVLSAVSLVGGAVEPVSAGTQPICAQINNGDFNGLGGSISFRSEFMAGNTIVVHSGEPIEIPIGGSPPSSTQLLINGTLVDSGGFPATLSYTFPADATYTVLYEVNEDNSNATFTATCTEGPPPTTSTTTTTTTTTVPPPTTSPATTSTSLATNTTAASATTSGATTTSAAASPGRGSATTVVRPLPATGRRGNADMIGIALLALVAGAVALLIARRRPA